jgi:hypothetical protein
MKRKQDTRICTSPKQSERNFRLSQKVKLFYGICYRCNQPIEIPGLEAFKCSGEYGWVSRKSLTHQLDPNKRAGGTA